MYYQLLQTVNKYIFKCAVGSLLPLVTICWKNTHLQLLLSPTVEYLYVFASIRPLGAVMMSPLWFGTTMDCI